MERTITTPFGYLASRVTLGPRALRWGTTAALVVSIFLVFSGGVVRVTGSGLGCPTWPACDATSLTTTPALGIHGLIEFGNRSMTGLLILAVGWAIVAARLQRPRNRPLTRLAWSQFWLVVANAIAGGISVLTGLNPYVVALHFLMAIALLTTTTLTWHRARETAPQAPLPRLSGPSVALSWALVACTIVLIAVGTLVSGSGPHSGDSAEVPRMGFVWADVTILHGILGAATIVIAVALWLSLRGSAQAALARRRVVFFVVVALVQAAIGLVQSLTGIPGGLVAIHLLGSALVWVGAIRVVLEVNPRLFSTLQAAPASAAVNPVVA
ncbi:MAG TPA: COX15/CtaA family protein [Lacisediminihabitans sp.]|uniref:COX15/CtaA family protein n=1 Tax=Lacisediminihabitans sp. TaxID=2787631 RepID=UPI002EDB1F57